MSILSSCLKYLHKANLMEQMELFEYISPSFFLASTQNFRKTAANSTAVEGFLIFFSLSYDSKIKRWCFVNFLVFSLSLSLSNWVIFSSLKLVNLLAAISDVCLPKITQARPQVFSVNGALTCENAAFLTSFPR